MKLTSLLAVLSLWCAPAATFAQENPTPPANTPDHSEGTKPHNRGSTGWGGGAREPEGKQATGSISSAPKPGEAAGQPPMASGVDLKGPPQQFPPNKTPE